MEGCSYRGAGGTVKGGSRDGGGGFGRRTEPQDTFLTVTGRVRKGLGCELGVDFFLAKGVWRGEDVLNSGRGRGGLGKRSWMKKGKRGVSFWERVEGAGSGSLGGRSHLEKLKRKFWREKGGGKVDCH